MNNTIFNKINPVNVFDRDTILHLRIPFSFFLLPVFCFAISQASNIHASTMWTVFIALHLFIYPGSNVYNSYMDEDTGSIGGLKNPPPVTKKLYYASIIVDSLGILVCLLAGWKLTLIAMGYIAFSKAYSWHGIRFKKYAWLGWAMVMFFQGGYTFMLGNMAADNNTSLTWFTAKNLECMLIASLFIGGYYPLTQIYQHEEDSERGDKTISYRLGIKGSFIFAGILFFAACVICYHYFTAYYSLSQFYLFIICQIPVIIYYNYWFIKTWQNNAFADYTHTMRMTFISSVCMIICFCLLYNINLN